MLIFLKLGGSLITDKQTPGHFRPEIVRRAAQEIAEALVDRPDLRLVIGHGSGSFGHAAAQQYGTADGVHTAADWRGFAEVSNAARSLNALVMPELIAAGLPVLSLQPSASAQCHNGRLESMATAPIGAALDHGLIPVIFGDVALDSVRGGAIVSTEALFFYLVAHLHPDRIILLGDMDGVYDAAGAIIPRITPDNYVTIAAALHGSHGTDVTGGMAAKVRTMLALAERAPGLESIIGGGTAPGQLRAILNGGSSGTVISAESGTA